MEFGFNVAVLFNADSEGVAIISGQELKNLSQTEKESIFMVLDEMGGASAKAQELKSVITTGAKFIGTDQKIFIKCQGKKAIGILKIGKKKLFIRDAIGTIKEISPTCLLDFYVHESQQRSGYGKLLFDKMLKTERLNANKLAYDRPSVKLLRFLEKNFNLVDYIPQNNNFVVYNDYFENTNFTKKVNNPNQKDNNNLYLLTNDSYRNFSYGAFSNQSLERNTKYNNEIKVNADKKIANSANNVKTPWASSANSDHFLSSSSSYGAYYVFEHKKNTKKFY